MFHFCETGVHFHLQFTLARLYRPPAAPWGLPNRKAASSYGCSGRKAYWGSLELHIHKDAPAVVTALSPDEPVILNRPQAAARAARFFTEKFPGKSLYAVKANPSPHLLQVLWDNGITHYDVASIVEVRLVRATLPEATLCFMHPVKPAAAIAEAYKVHGVRTFSLDTQEELEKIVAATADENGNTAEDLSLCVRLRVSSEYSELSLAAKFGIDLADAAPLLQATRQVADCLGICFHVGSQAMTPFAYVQALERVRAAIVDAAVTVDIVDVGGGFPSIYPGMEPPPLEDYFGAIHRAAPHSQSSQ